MSHILKVTYKFQANIMCRYGNCNQTLMVCTYSIIKIKYVMSFYKEIFILIATLMIIASYTISFVRDGARRGALNS